MARSCKHCDKVADGIYTSPNGRRDLLCRRHFTRRVNKARPEGTQRIRSFSDAQAAHTRDLREQAWRKKRAELEIIQREARE